MWTFLSPPFYLVQYQHEKRLTSQPDALPDEGFLGTAALVGSLDFVYFGTEQGGS